MATHKFYLVSFCLTWLLCIASAEVVSFSSCDENPGIFLRIYTCILNKQKHTAWQRIVGRRNKKQNHQEKLNWSSSYFTIIKNFQFVIMVQQLLSLPLSPSFSPPPSLWFPNQKSYTCINKIFQQKIELIKCITNHLCDVDLLTLLNLINIPDSIRSIFFAFPFGCSTNRSFSFPINTYLCAISFIRVCVWTLACFQSGDYYDDYYRCL